MRSTLLSRSAATTSRSCSSRGFAFRWNDKRVESSLAGDFKTGRIGTVRNHDRNAGVGNPASRNAVGDGNKVGAPSGKENAEILHQDNIIHQPGVEVTEKIVKLKRPGEQFVGLRFLYFCNLKLLT